MKNYSSVPPQRSGASSDTSATYKASSSEEAKKYFKAVRERLLNVNDWKIMAVLPSADFTLCDESGRKVDRLAKQGDYLRINIPGPDNQSGDRDDWVKVEHVEEKYSVNVESIVVTVRPSANPKHPAETAHFFSDEATSSFVVERRAEELIAAVYGRNEKPNTDAGSLKENIRNSVVATVAMGLFSKIQWKSLVNGLIKREID